MKTLQKYILSLLMIVSTVSMCAMDGRESQTSSLQAIVVKQIVAEELEQISTEQNKELHKKKIVPVLQQLERRAPLKASKKLNLQLDILSVDLLKNENLEYLVGSSGRDQDKEPYFTFTIDRKVRPWMLINKQRDAIVQAVRNNNYKQLKDFCGLLDAYTSLFISPKAPKSSDFIKNYKGKYGLTALHYSARFEGVRLTKLLIDRGATIEAKDECGLTPLHESAWYGRTNTTRLLVDSGANIDIQDKLGRTPLALAVAAGKKRTVQLLLDLGANIDIRSHSGFALEQVTWSEEMRYMIFWERCNRRLSNINEQIYCSIM